MPSNNTPDLKRDLIFLILQYLDEEKFKETIHKLEKESLVYFNMKYFENTILNGNWEEAEGYVSGFIKINESVGSLSIFFHLYWHKYFESIIRGEREKALDILNNELKAFEPIYPQLYKEMAQHITIPSMEHPPRFTESYMKSLRIRAVTDINNLIVSHPLLYDKLHFPIFSGRRLRTLLSQRLDGQNLLGNGHEDK